MTAAYHRKRNPLRKLADCILPPLAWLLCRGLGLIAWYLSSRKEVALRNLHRAFPDKPRGWHERIGKQSVTRMFEMFLVPMVAPWISETEIDRRFGLAPGARDTLEKLRKNGGCVVQVPHCTMTEGLVLLPRIWRSDMPMMTFYRPLDFKPMDRYILRARQTWGMELHSRKEGLIRGRNVLREGGLVGILFDQNARGIGALTLFMGAVCSSTDLPGILATKTGRETLLMYPRRTGFFRAEIELLPIPHDGTAMGITAGAAKALEDKLLQSDEDCADWLWVHKRWKALKSPGKRLNLNQKKSALEQSLALRSLDSIPRRLRYVFRLPANPEQARVLASRLESLRRSRPDAHCTVLAPTDAADVFKVGKNCEALHLFRNASDLRQILQSMATEWPECLFTLDLEADPVRERKLCNAETALGIARTPRGRSKGVHWFVLDDEALSSPGNYPALLDFFLTEAGMAMEQSEDVRDADNQPVT